MRFRSLLLLACFSFSTFSLLSQEMLILYPDTMEAAIKSYADLRSQSGIYVRLSPLGSSHPTGSHDILRLIREANDSLALDYVLLVGPPAILPPFRNALGSLSDYPYSLPDSTGPRLAVGRLPSINRMQLIHYTKRVATIGVSTSRGKVCILPATIDRSHAADYCHDLSLRGINTKIISSSELGKDSCELFIYIGQGSSQAWLDAGINVQNADSLFRVSPSVILSIACSTANILGSRSLPMKLMFDHKKLLNLIGCMGNCLLEESARLGLYIVAQWQAGKPIGKIWKEAERSYLHSGGDLERMQHTLGEFILWGDPSLIPFKKNPDHGQRK